MPLIRIKPSKILIFYSNFFLLRILFCPFSCFCLKLFPILLKFSRNLGISTTFTSNYWLNHMFLNLFNHYSYIDILYKQDADLSLEYTLETSFPSSRCYLPYNMAHKHYSLSHWDGKSSFGIPQSSGAQKGIPLKIELLSRTTH